MNSHRRRRVAALVLAGSCALAAPGGAVAADAHQQPVSAKIGDTPADYYAQPVAPAPKVGDTPVDDPGASRARQNTAPATLVPASGRSTSTTFRWNSLRPVELDSSA